jgi:hypothetical protein
MVGGDAIAWTVLEGEELVRLEDLSSRPTLRGALILLDALSRGTVRLRVQVRGLESVIALIIR